jgi:Ca2+/H+ antiporter
MLMLAVIALGIPSLFSHAIEVGTGHMAVEYLSLGVAGAMLLVYVLIPIVFVKAINAYSELLGDIYGGNPAHAF